MKPPIELILPSAPAIDGLAFPECPRWHADAWWFSDMHGQAIYRIAEDGSLTTVLELDDRPAGLGFIGATMYAVAMTRRELLEVKNQQITRRVDLKGVAPYHCNDMVMDMKGRAYIGNFGFNFEAHEEPKTTGLALVREDGTVHQVADHLLFPNGMVLTDDGKSLIVAESYGRCLTAADTQAGQPAFGIAPHHFMQQGHENTATGCANRMAQGNRAAINVDLAGIPAHFLVDGNRLRREGFVDLHQVNVLMRPACFFQA